MNSSSFEGGQYLVDVNVGCWRCQLLHHQHSVCLAVLLKQVKKRFRNTIVRLFSISTVGDCGNFSTVLTEMSFVFACLQVPAASHLILGRFDIRSYNKNWHSALNNTKIYSKEIENTKSKSINTK